MRNVTLHRLYASEPIGDLSSSFPGEFVKENTIFWPIEKKCLSRFLEPKTEKKVDLTNPWNFHFFKLSYFSENADVDFETPKNQTKSSQTRSRRQKKSKGIGSLAQNLGRVK